MHQKANRNNNHEQPHHAIVRGMRVYGEQTNVRTEAKKNHLEKHEKSRGHYPHKVTCTHQTLYSFIICVAYTIHSATPHWSTYSVNAVSACAYIRVAHRIFIRISHWFRCGVASKIVWKFWCTQFGWDSVCEPSSAASLRCSRLEFPWLKSCETLFGWHSNQFTNSFPFSFRGDGVTQTVCDSEINELLSKIKTKGSNRVGN